MFQVRKKRPQDVSKPDFFSFDEGTATLQFPHETIPVPDHGRYKLHNEIDDCIVCDKCAKVCPVNCIEIVPIRSPESFGETSDGTPKRIYAETFNIDMGKCMFCGLCTTVCPTECLTMTPEYDYSTFDIRDHLFPFGQMTDAEVKQRKMEWEKYQAGKEAAPAVKPTATEAGKAVSTGGAATAEPKAKPVFKPRPMPAKKPQEPSDSSDAPKPKPVFKPRVMPPKRRKDD